MSEDRLKRFAPSEIAMHWISSVPFLSLLFSGGLLLFRPEFLSAKHIAGLIFFHKVLAVIWTCALLLTLLTNGPRQHFRNLKSFFIWKKRDFLWMIASLAALVAPGTKIPKAKKFNAGQKMNGMGTVVIATTSIISGAMMWVLGTALLPWYIHVAGAALSVNLISGHLYMALINPSTRIALGGIFNGWVPRRYVEHHHALSLEEENEVKEDAGISWGRISRVRLAGAIVLAIAGVAAGAAGMIFSGRLLGPVNNTMQPGPVIAAHAPQIDKDGCTSCHQWTKPIPNGSCLDCHKMIGNRIAKRVGYHGAFDEPCRTCHLEHRGREANILPLVEETFNHKLAQFQLRGKHAEVQCEKCHLADKMKADKRGRYIGIPHQQCQTCHADPHKGRLGAECRKCHTEEGWQKPRLKFNHDVDCKFPLSGKHNTLQCTQCHKPATKTAKLASATFRGLKTECNSCHKDPHKAKLGNACQKCHTPDGWKGKAVKFAHDRDTKFPLSGKHVRVSCTKCHRPSPKATLAMALAKPLASASCKDCHKDPHRGQFKKQCTTCHTTEGWRGRKLTFTHKRDTTFQLDGKHAKVACTKCHKPAGTPPRLSHATFRGKKQDCASCHKDPHFGSYGSQCARCHSPAGWKGRTMIFVHNRDTRFPLTGKHTKPACTKCHLTRSKRPRVPLGAKAAVSCTLCHKDPHKSRLGTNCASCHTSQGWKGNNLLFTHKTHSKFKLDGVHARVACAQCHTRGARSDFKKTSKTCGGCHQDLQTAMAGTLPGLKGKPDVHAKDVSCTKCHDTTTPASNRLTRAKCSQCHNKTYDALYLDWQHLLGQRAAEARLKADRIQNAKERARAYDRIKTIQAIGVHNFPLAEKALKQWAESNDTNRKNRP